MSLRGSGSKQLGELLEPEKKSSVSPLSSRKL